MRAQSGKSTYRSNGQQDVDAGRKHLSLNFVGAVDDLDGRHHMKAGELVHEREGGGDHGCKTANGVSFFWDCS